MNFSRFFRMQIAMFLTCIALALAPTGVRAAAARPGQVTQVILFWLKRPGNADDQNYLLRVLRTLRRARGVNEVRFGRPLPMDRASLDESFDLGAVVIFRDREALKRFQRDQQPEKAIDAMLGPLIRRYSVYNFANE
jgi:NAD(P)-dependent dehydrogenase (short-subunit alcohol dehydrogenase family)